MGNHKRYLSQKDRYNFLIDHTETVLRIRFYKIEVGDVFKNLKVNSRGQYVRDLYETGEKITLRRRDEVFFVEVPLKFNFNRRLRYFYKEYFGLKRISSIWSHGDNVIPSQVRELLIRDNISLSDVRKKGYEIYFEHVEFVRSQIVLFLKERLNIEWQKHWIEWALNAVEIDYDISTLSEVELSTISRIRWKFNEEVNKVVKDTAFTNDGKTATIPIGGKITDTWKSSADKEPRMLVGFFKDDKSLLRLYLKESGKFMAVNRLERRFEGRPCLCKHFEGNTIKSENDFIAKINSLAEATFDSGYCILSGRTHYSDKMKARLLKKACRRHGGKYWYDMYTNLKNSGVIHSGSMSCSSLKGVARRASDLCRQGILFKRKNAGVYIVNWSWLLSMSKSNSCARKS